MRKTLIAGNWKMNGNRESAAELARSLVARCGNIEAELLICPAFVHLQAVAENLEGSGIRLGAQNVYHQADGAFTGEISVSMLNDIGCRFVILGHSERRHVLGESDQDVNAKLRAVLDGGLNPIVCLGELLEERESGRTQDVVTQQFEQSCAGLTDAEMSATVIAYEPVWAIGTGKVATPEQAQEVHADLRKLVEKRYNSSVSSAVRILYGGSVKPDNAAELVGQTDIDGALVGGASLNADSFLAIASANQSSR